MEVMESLPEILQKCFESQDIAALQKAVTEMPEKEAAYHIQRCIDSGLWVPGGGEDKEKEASGDGADGEASNDTDEVYEEVK